MHPYTLFLQEAKPLINDLIVASNHLSDEAKQGGPVRKWAAHQKFRIMGPQEVADQAATNLMTLLVSYMPQHWMLPAEAYVKRGHLRWSSNLPGCVKSKLLIPIAPNSLIHFLAQMFVLAEFGKAPDLAQSKTYAAIQYDPPYSTPFPNQDAKIENFFLQAGLTEKDAFAQYVLKQHKTPYPSVAKRGPQVAFEDMLVKYTDSLQYDFARTYFGTLNAPWFPKASAAFQHWAFLMVNRGLQYRKFPAFETFLSQYEILAEGMKQGPKLPRKIVPALTLKIDGSLFGPKNHAFADVVHLLTLTRSIERHTGYHLGRIDFDLDPDAHSQPLASSLVAWETFLKTLEKKA